MTVCLYESLNKYLILDNSFNLREAVSETVNNLMDRDLFSWAILRELALSHSED